MLRLAVSPGSSAVSQAAVLTVMVEQPAEFATVAPAMPSPTTTTTTTTITTTSTTSSTPRPATARQGQGGESGRQGVVTAGLGEGMPPVAEGPD